MTIETPPSPRDWVTIEPAGTPAVVSSIRADGRIEVVYLDGRDRAINEDLVWRGGSWRFAHEGVDGGYADKSARLQPYVEVLRRGRL